MSCSATGLGNDRALRAAYLRFSHQSSNAKLTANIAPATLTHMGMIVLSTVTRHSSNSRKRCRNAASASTTMVKVVNGFMPASS